MGIGENLDPPDSKWWLRRLRRVIRLLKEEGLNKQGETLIKFSVYSTFLDLTDAAMRENNEEVYNKAKQLIDEVLPNDRPTVR